MTDEFLDHVHEFDALQGGPGRTEGLEPQHGADDPFHGPVVLFYPVVEVLDRAHLDLGTGFFLERVKGRRVGPALVDGDLLRETLLSNGFLEEAPGGLLVAVGGQQEVDGLTVPIDGAVEVLPLAFDLDVVSSIRPL